MLLNIDLTASTGAAFVSIAAGLAGRLENNFARKKYSAAPAVRIDNASATMINVNERRCDTAGDADAVAGASFFGGMFRGLAASDAERTNLWSADAWGTTILRKQVGQSSSEPVALESAVMCWPHTGQANLNSLMADKNISQPGHPDNLHFPS
ncbi:MAG TPA: hypothetical protein VK327_03760 [Candidatus Paceibacterota bacterium]|nr:hypothetical protein [Candidatus Paceibacterota bacterium]